MAQVEGEPVIRLSDLSDHLEYYTPTELRRFLKGYKYENKGFWRKAFSMFHREFRRRVLGYIVDFTYDGDIDRIVAVIAECKRREIKLIDLEKWAKRYEQE